MVLSFRKQNRTELVNEINSYIKSDIQYLFSYTAWACGNKKHAEQVIAHAFKKVVYDIHSTKTIKNIKNHFHKALKAQCDKQKSLYPVSKKLTSNAFQTKSPENAFQLVLKKIPERYSHPLVMQVIGHFSIPGIADILKVSEKEVMVSLSSARRMVSAFVSLEQTISLSSEKLEMKMTPAKYLNDLLVGMDEEAQLSPSI